MTVPPEGFWKSAWQPPPADARAFAIRVDYGNAADSGKLSVYTRDPDGDETRLAHGHLKACGVALWVIDVNR